MTDFPRDPNAVLKSLRLTVFTCFTSRLVEARIGSILLSKCPNFVQSAEGAPVDCGLIIDSDFRVSDPKSHTARLSEAVRQYSSAEKLLALDYKCIAPKLIYPRYQSYFFKLELQPAQENCAALILANPARPQLVALVPQSLVGTGATHITSLVPGRVEPFPLQWSAFVMRLQDLPFALRSLQGFAEKGVLGWRNPYNNITFEHTDGPQLVSVDNLIQRVPAASDFNILIRIFDAFRKYNKHYAAEKPLIQPSAGDVIIHHVPTDQRIVLEIKQGILTVHKDGINHHLLGRRRPDIGPERIQRFFSPVSVWDFLFTISGHLAYLVRRDELPERWFLMSTLEMSKQISAPWDNHDAEWFDAHRIPLTDDEAMVNHFVKLLDQYREISGLRCPEKKLMLDSVPECCTSLEILTDVHKEGDSSAQYREYAQGDVDMSDEEERVIDERKSDDEETGISERESFGVGTDIKDDDQRHAQSTLEQLHSIDQPDNPSKTHRSQFRYQHLFSCAQVRIISEAHDTRLYGQLFHLGTHPSGAWAYVQSVDSHITFTDLAPNTPLLFVTIANIKIDDCQNPDFGRLGRRFQHLFAAQSSLFLLVPRPSVLNNSTLNCFIVPSDKFNLDDFRGSSLTSSNRFSLIDRGVIDRYTVPVNAVLPALSSFMDAADGTLTLPNGHHLRLTDSADFKKFLYNKREACRQYLLQELDRHVDCRTIQDVGSHGPLERPATRSTTDLGKSKTNQSARSNA